jgi:hypothetical protein
LLPLCLLGGFPWSQFEIASVKQRVTRREKAKLCRTKDVTGGQQHNIEIMYCSPFTKWQHMLGANARQSGVHQTRGAIGKDDLIMGRNVVAVRVRNEGEALCIPRVEPEILLWQINTAVKTNVDHHEIYA